MGILEAMYEPVNRSNEVNRTGLFWLRVWEGFGLLISCVGSRLLTLESL